MYIYFFVNFINFVSILHSYFHSIILLWGFHVFRINFETLKLCNQFEICYSSMMIKCIIVCVHIVKVMFPHEFLEKSIMFVVRSG